MQITFNEDLILRQIDVKKKDEVLSKLVDKLIKQDLVKEEYKKAILSREREYPTGLPSSVPMVAIPHADYNLVNQTSIAVATLKEPVTFNNMESVKEEVDVQIVILLAIKEPHGQIEMLQRIISFIQSDVKKVELLNSVTNEEMKKIIEEELIKEN